ncbi:unnamed protein product [Heligmosomoides polygyrus]|uniref:Lipase_3 domain-containing protein n=1 Tax=Heligmosomoides polygyrus TaxID=6339 RepID=A0A3P8BCJ3_HELPZ|nr:unnamed protein product [Heligmosomoides polygyrus]
MQVSKLPFSSNSFCEREFQLAYGFWDSYNSSKFYFNESVRQLSNLCLKHILAPEKIFKKSEIQLPKRSFALERGSKGSGTKNVLYRGSCSSFPHMEHDQISLSRSFIIAVRQYTGTQVDVVAYSMGSPIARKAILGGQCVDTREILGKRIDLVMFRVTRVNLSPASLFLKPQHEYLTPPLMCARAKLDFAAAVKQGARFIT